jgi:peptidoglycan/LPS O-acetylase OafA/YrhL
MKSLILFTLTQSSFLQFWTPQNLREFGCGTPNGSLWTIGIFIQFYITAYILYRWIKPTLLYEHSHITFKFVLLGIISICCTIAYPRMTIFFDGGINSVYYKLIGQTIFPYLYMFLTGIIIFEYKEYLLHNFQRFTLLYFTLLYFTL